VEHGIGSTRNVWLALTDGLSTLRTSVYLYLTNAHLVMSTETVLLATRDTILTTGSVYTHFPTMLIQLILDAELGTGTTKSAFSALTDGFSMLPKLLVLLCLINALLMMLMEIALLVIWAMT
jgi:hypothetical protein